MDIFEVEAEFSAVELDFDPSELMRVVNPRYAEGEYYLDVFEAMGEGTFRGMNMLELEELVDSGVRPVVSFADVQSWSKAIFQYLELTLTFKADERVKFGVFDGDIVTLRLPTLDEASAARKWLSDNGYRIITFKKLDS